MADRVERTYGGEDFEVFVFGLDVFGTGFEGDVHELLFVYLVFADDELSGAVEHEGDGVGSGEVASAFGEGGAHVGCGAVFVVCGHFDDDGDSMRGVAFVDEFFVDDAGEFAGSFFDGALDVVGGHVLGAGLEQDGAELGIHVRISSSVFCGQGDVLGNTAEDFAALGICRAFFVLNGRPLAMSGHGLN